MLAWGAAVAEILLAGVPLRRAIGKMLLAWGAATRGDVVARGRAVARGGAMAEILLPGRPIGNQLSELMSCSQQYVSKVLKGQENLSLETMSKIEACLGIQIFPTSEM